MPLCFWAGPGAAVVTVETATLVKVSVSGSPVKLGWKIVNVTLATVVTIKWLEGGQFTAVKYSCRWKSKTVIRNIRCAVNGDIGLPKTGVGLSQGVNTCSLNQSTGLAGSCKDCRAKTDDPGNEHV